MNNNHQAGRSTREMAENRRKTGIWIGVIGIVLIIIVGALLQSSKALGIGGAGLLVLLVLLGVDRRSPTGFCPPFGHKMAVIPWG